MMDYREMMMKKKIKGTVIVIALLHLLILCACDSEKKEQYYSEKNNYVNATGIVTHIKYNESEDMLYLGFSDLKPTFDDDTFKIVGDNLSIVQANGIDEKIAIGTEMEFVTAPKYYGDGYVMPIVAITVDGEQLLEFEEGYVNFLKWLEVR